MIGQLGQGLRRPDANAYGQPEPFVDAGADLAAVCFEAGRRKPVEREERLVDRIDFDVRREGFEDFHDPVAHVRIEGVVRAEGDDPVPLSVVADLEPRHGSRASGEIHPKQIRSDRGRVGKSVPDFVLHGFPNAFVVARKSVVLSYTYPQANLCQAAITPGQNSTRTGGQI